MDTYTPPGFKATAMFVPSYVMAHAFHVPVGTVGDAKLAPPSPETMMPPPSSVATMTLPSAEEHTLVKGSPPGELASWAQAPPLYRYIVPDPDTATSLVPSMEDAHPVQPSGGMGATLQLAPPLLEMTTFSVKKPAMPAAAIKLVPLASDATALYFWIGPVGAHVTPESVLMYMVSLQSGGWGRGEVW